MPRADGRGRPTKLTPEVRKKFLVYIREGNCRRDACAVAGIKYCALQVWITHGRREKRGV
jgi:hypothetical protein